MPSLAAISSADSPEPRRNALSRLPISSKRSIQRSVDRCQRSGIRGQMIVFGAAVFVIRPPRTDNRPRTLTPPRERCIHSAMKPAAFRYHAPKTIDEAVALLAEFAAEDGRVLAGGQRLVPTMAFRLPPPSLLVGTTHS